MPFICSIIAFSFFCYRQVFLFYIVDAFFMLLLLFLRKFITFLCYQNFLQQQFCAVHKYWNTLMTWLIFLWLLQLEDFISSSNSNLSSALRLEVLFIWCFDNCILKVLFKLSNLGNLTFKINNLIIAKNVFLF